MLCLYYAITEVIYEFNEVNLLYKGSQIICKHPTYTQNNILKERI